MNFIKRIFGSSNDRNIRRMQIIVNKINEFEESISKKPDEYFLKIKDQIKKDFNTNSNIHEIIPLAYAVVREASKRTIGLRHFDSQMLGGIALIDGDIAEMKTGEGKTLVATLPAYLNCAIGKKTILVTVNDYLAKRDAEWMKPVFEFLGLKVGTVTSNQPNEEKKESYKCDVIYGTNNELGFDYLRDNMARTSEEKVQCSLDFAIIDEVDSILIDEARTPLIISGPTAENSNMYESIRKLIPRLKQQQREETEENPLMDNEKGHFIIDEKNRTVDLTDDGYLLVEELLEELEIIGKDDGLYSVSNLKLMKFVQASLKAQFMFQKNVHYLVRNNEVLLIDEHTGRTMPGRRLSEGIHQALECKERVTIQRESQTLASTTFQNFFRLFNKLSGMTGTADTEALEFNQIYGLNVVVIPTHKEMIRIDNNDLVFLTKEAKFKALISKIKEIQKKAAPVLIGTVSVESSEAVSTLLSKNAIKHQILNAKHHEKEAEIIANAGKPNMVTIATNMAGRGTDIVLGGKKEEQTQESWIKNNESVINAGGLHILGTERHESRRIDNQLRGRSGRQGDPGFSQFFLSLEDDLLRLFISDNRRALFERIGMGEEHIEHRMLSRGIENAQKRIEGRNFEARKNLLEYDDVSKDQRQAIYSLRNELLEAKDIHETIQNIIHNEFQKISESFIPPDSVESQWKVKELDNFLKENFLLEIDMSKKVKNDKSLLPDDISKILVETSINFYQEKYNPLKENLSFLEKQIMLQVLDVHWKEHLAEIDHLRGSIGLRAYAQKNPKNEFKREAYALFEEMLNLIDSETIRILFNLKIRSHEDIADLKSKDNQEVKLEHAEPQITEPQNNQSNKNINNPISRSEPKIGRNDFIEITNGKETRKLKYKKALPLIQAGEWKII